MSRGEAPSRKAIAPVVGRRVAIAIYIVSVLFVAAAGLRSVAAQVFWPHFSEQAAKDLPPDCRAALEALRVELTMRAGTFATVAAEGASQDPGGWLGDWDDHHAAAAQMCADGGESAWSSLATERYALEQALRRFESHVQPRGLEARREVRALGQAQQGNHDRH